MAKRRAQRKPEYEREPGESDALPEPEPKPKVAQKLLGDWLPEVSPTLRKAVDLYDDLYEEKSQLGTKVKSAKLNALAIMREEGLKSVRLRNGEYLCLTTEYDLVHKSYEKLANENGSQDREDQAQDVE